MNILVVSSGLDPNSRSRKLAQLCHNILLRREVEVRLADLAEFDIPNFDNDAVYRSDAYIKLHALAAQSTGLVLCSPVYNWGCSAELKKYIEYVGSTPPNGPHTGALFDKVVTFVNSGGLPHSYTAFRELATALMLDFKCVVNPYHLYAHNRHWQGKTLDDGLLERAEKTLQVMTELCVLLEGRSYSSTWEI